MKRYLGLFLVALAAVGAVAAPASAQTWPNKPIRVVTVGTGGALDLTLRAMSQVISPSLGQRIVVENRPSSTHPEQVVLKSPADGYTLLYWANPLWLTPFMADVDYDPIKDFAPITLAAQVPSVLVINADVPAKSVKELVALAKAKPGQLNVAMTSSRSSSNSLAALLFETMAGIDMTEINYKDTGQTITDLIAGRVQVGFPSLAGVMAHIKSGKLRALGVTTAQPSAQLPDVPALKSTYPDFESASVHGMWAVANTPQAIITRMNQEVIKALKDPAVRETLLNTGVEPVGSTPEQLTATMRNEMRVTGKLIKDKGIRAD